VTFTAGPDDEVFVDVDAVAAVQDDAFAGKARLVLDSGTVIRVEGTAAAIVTFLRQQQATAPRPDAVVAEHRP
jgi:hypothetical protein